MRKKLYICSLNWELSSVGSEHRPYKAGVVGSSPTVPTKRRSRDITTPSLFPSNKFSYSL